MKSPLHVLVLDDDEKILRLLKIFLKQLHYTVSTGLNGKEGFQLMLEHSFDLVIVDVQMPVVDGFAFAEQALKIWPWQKLIFCTGNNTPDVRRQATAFGFPDILEKPLSFNTLESSIQKICGPETAEGSKGQSPGDPCQLGVELGLLRKFTRKILPAYQFGSCLQGAAKCLHELTPGASAAGLFGLQGDYQTLTLSSNAPLSTAFSDELVNRIQSHIEFIKESGLHWIARPEVAVRDPNAREITPETHYFLFSPVPGPQGSDVLQFLVLPGQRPQHPPEELKVLLAASHHLATLLDCTEHEKGNTLRDNLTGLYSRCFLEECTEQAWQLARIRKKPVGLLSLDLDDFKTINDRFGYRCGDQVLARVAGVVRGLAQTGEIAAHFNGDEFSILLPETTIDRAQLLAESLDRDITSLKFVFDGETVEIRCSIGFAVTVEGHGITSSSQLIECAEHARFVAKRTPDQNYSSWTQLKASGQASYNLHPVLVVDDDPQILVLVKRLLNKNMYEVSGVGSVADAMALLQQGNRYEVLLTDLALPHQDGLEMMRLAAEIDPSMVPVVISGNISQDSEQRLIQRGAFAIIKKPFSPERLREVVSKAVEHHTRSSRKES